MPNDGSLTTRSCTAREGLRRSNAPLIVFQKRLRRWRASAHRRRWAGFLSGFLDQYARARTAKAEAMFEDMLAIADDGSRDRVMVDGKLRVDNEVAARSRLRVDSRRWALSKLAPVKYGEKVTNVLEGGERPVEFAGMTDDQLRAWIVKEARTLGLGGALAVEVTATAEDTTHLMTTS